MSQPPKMAQPDDDSMKIVQRLRLTEERLQKAMSIETVGVLLFSLDGKMTDANKTFERMSGYTKEELRTIDWHKLTPPEFQEITTRHAEILARTGETPPYEKRMVRKDGTYWWGLFSPTRLAGTGTESECMEFIIDITDRKHFEASLREDEERSRAFSAELEKLVNERTQDLLNARDRLRLLASELNLAEHRERKRLASDLHDYLQQNLVYGKLRLGEGKRQAQSIPTCANIIEEVNDLLTDALTYTRTLVAELSPPALRHHGLVAGLTWLADYMKNRGMTVIVTSKSSDELRLPEDQAVLVFQSVRELLINCAKHATKRPIKVTLKALNHLLRIEVRDEGPGFDAATVLSDTVPKSSESSSKFGLFSIKERMEALGGHFHVDSSPGSGTCAMLELPLSASQAEGDQVSSINNNSRKRLRVLLVDDHAMVRQGLKSLLESYEGVELVGEAGNGKEAVYLVRQFVPEVVVMDIQMPEMDGIEATRIIKSEFPNTKVIGLSVNADEGKLNAMKKAGAALLMSKEAAVEELYSIVTDA